MQVFCGAAWPKVLETLSCLQLLTLSAACKALFGCMKDDVS